MPGATSSLIFLSSPSAIAAPAVLRMAIPA
jgi:hypothetical protein